MAWRLSVISWMALLMVFIYMLDIALWSPSDPFMKLPAGEYQVAGMKEPLPEVKLLVIRYSPEYRDYLGLANMILCTGILLIAGSADWTRKEGVK